MSALDALRGAVEAAARELRGERPPPTVPPGVQRPKQAAHGDYATNAALLLAPGLGEPPRAIAERLADLLQAALGEALERVEVAGPGFLNLFLADAWYAEAVAGILTAGEGFGGAVVAAPERVLVEFVSANPTGPLTAASGRHAAYGDALVRLLRFAGHEVAAEYYVNDFGSQVLRLGESIRARARGEAVPEDGYRGEYVAELAAAIPGAAGAEPAQLAQRGVELMIERIRGSLEAFGCHFDRFTSEAALHAGPAPTPVRRAEQALEDRGQVYRSEGATWLRTTAFGDDKDRVLLRSGGEPTYFQSDIAYHQDKHARGFGLLIDVWGADHHGYVRRLQAAWAALGGDEEALEIVIMQYVHLIDAGGRAGMSKRRGDFITLDALVEEIGVDAARYFLVGRSHETEMDLDLDLARSQSAENPVYYVQYAHARIASIRRRAGEVGVVRALRDAGKGPSVALHPAERALVRKLLDLPGEVTDAAERRAPHRIAAWALECAQVFTAFYRDCQILGAEPASLEGFRLALAVATQGALARTLALLGVGAPQEM